jgi:putative ABC transport system permease protein
VVLVNQRLAALCWPNEDPIGRRIRFGGDRWAEVVGVIADARIMGPADVPPLEVVAPHRQVTGTSLTFVLRASTGDPTALAPAVRRAVAAIDPQLPLQEMASMDAVVSGSLGQQRLVSTLLGGFALLAAVLALVGVNGLMAYTISRQRHELGVRLAMGASPASLAWMILARAGVLAGAGIALGILGALGLTRFLRVMLYQVTPTDPGVIAVTCAAVLVAALAACVAPARTAARVDPIETLRAL